MEDPAEGDWHDAWETVQRGHAIANSVCVAAANRVGWEEDLKFWGSSFVCDSFGKIVARASSSEEEVLIAELDLAKNELVREGWGFFRNRRPDVYWPLIEMVKVEDSGKKGRKGGNRILSGGHASAIGLPHACRMGRARGDLARLAL